MHALVHLDAQLGDTARALEIGLLSGDALKLVGVWHVLAGANALAGSRTGRGTERARTVDVGVLALARELVLGIGDAESALAIMDGFNGEVNGV